MITQTKIPEGWKEAKLKEIGHFSKGSGISKAELVDTGINAIRYGELYTTHHFKVKKIHSFIPESSTKTSRKIKYGDIIFAGSGETIDEIGKSTTYLSHSDCYVGGDTIILSPKNANSLFLTYTLNIGSARKELRRLGQGQSVVHLYRSDLENLSISLPPLPEQEKTVEVLETWDSYLEKLTKIIKSKKQIKRCLTRILFTGNTRLSGYKDEWADLSLENIVVKKGLVRGPFGGSLKKSFFAEKGYKVYEQKNAIYRSSQLGSYFIDDDKFGELRRFELLPGDFIVSCSGTIGRIFRIPAEAPPGVINQALLKIRLDMSIINSDYFYHYFAWDEFQQKIIDSTQGGAMQNLVGMEIFRKTKIVLPSLKEQTAIACILTAADQEIEALEKKRELIEAQKKFLLNNLVTGKIRLPEFINAN